MARFNEAVPDGAARIFTKFEEETAHRVALERDSLTMQSAALRRGQWLGAAVMVLAMIGAIILGIAGAPWEIGVAFLAVPICGVIKALIDRK